MSFIISFINHAYDIRTFGGNNNNKKFGGISFLKFYYVDNLNLLIFSLFSFHIARTLMHEFFFQWHEQLKSPNVFWTINAFQIINPALKRGSNCYRSCVVLQHNYWKYVQLRFVSRLYPINMEGPTKNTLF